MRSLLRLALIALAVGLAERSSAAGQCAPVAPDRPIEEAVDHYVDARLAEAHVKPAERADGAALIRRLTLDLAGRIPTEAEMRAFVASDDAGKLRAAVDRLTASPAFARHLADELDSVLMAGTRGSLRGYLARALREDRRWDQIFRELLLADESDPKRDGSAAFLRQRVKDLDRLTSDVSSMFFGVNVSCAKCHDHPKVPDWKQDHFYGMKSFFARTYQAGTFVGENDFGGVKFLTTSGEEKAARFMFLTGRVVDAPDVPEPSKEEQRVFKKRLAEARQKKQAPPSPRWSARAELVRVALETGQRAYFSRAIVNRLWHRLFGVGLVMPLDQMHAANPPSHPELLDWLARDLEEHGYDLKRLVRGLVLSRAYARSSRSETGNGDEPDPRLFAVASVRPLSPMQLATSLWVTTTDPEALPASLSAQEIEAKLDAIEERARTLAQSIARPGEDYQIGVSEALLFSNSDRTAALLDEKGDRLVGRLLKIGDRTERAAAAVRSVLSRLPEDDELSLLAGYLADRDERPAEGCRQLVWALLTSAEFRFNH